MKLMLRALVMTTAILTSAAALAQEAPAANTSPKDYTILKLGNESIQNSEVLEIWRNLFPNGSAPDFANFDENIRLNVLRGIVSERLIYQQAVKDGYEKSEEVKKRLAALEKQVVMQTFMENKARDLVSDADLRKSYDEKVAELKGVEEVKARHILVATEEEAKDIAKQLKKGSDFEKIAEDKSTDKGSGKEGGDLGWFTKDKMVPEFAEAAFNLKKGDISEPVKSAFGWHIIKVEDRRAVKIPAYEEMKDSLVAELSNKAVQAYVENMLKAADIKYYSADGKTKDFPRTLVPAAGE
jgi:peptidyl-prolyl cis-trans isomerase C